MVDAFSSPADRPWQGVSPRLKTLRVFRLAPLVTLPWWLVSAFAWNASPILRIALVLLGFIAFGITFFLIVQNYKSWGFVERDEDLWVMHGRFFKKLVVVPYGRMQVVDLNAGPMERALGIAKVKLHTAAATTDAVIVGLENAEASKLRDRMTALGEAMAAGL